MQIDAAEHRWFEGRGASCTLLVFIDDPTERMMQLRVVESESAAAYFAALRGYLEARGRPVAFYSDGEYGEIYHYADDQLDIRWWGHSLPYSVFDKGQRVGQDNIVENKHLGAALALVEE